MTRLKKSGTKTSSFGVSKRENHDSSMFYKSKLYKNTIIDEKMKEVCNPVGKALDKIIHQNSTNMANLPDSSIHLMVTSPPYNVGKDYDVDLDINEYFTFLKNVFSETYRVLVDGGRVCINIANVGRKPYIPYHKYIIDAMHEIGFFMRGEIIWNKAAGGGASTAWGSWASASNPTLRDTHEYILIFSKTKFSRNSMEKENTIKKNEFLEYTKSVWTFPPQSAKKVGHPAPFPLELPYRCMQLYSFKEDIVLDPFCGVGTTCLAAIQTGRHYVGFDDNLEYVKKAKKRIKEYIEHTKISQSSIQ